MCAGCLGVTSSRLAKETGISRTALAMIDTMVTQAISYGALSVTRKTEGLEPIEGDPTATIKELLVRHIANLENFHSYENMVAEAAEEDDDDSEGEGFIVVNLNPNLN